MRPELRHHRRELLHVFEPHDLEKSAPKFERARQYRARARDPAVLVVLEQRALALRELRRDLVIIDRARLCEPTLDSDQLAEGLAALLEQVTEDQTRPIVVEMRDDVIDQLCLERHGLSCLVRGLHGLVAV